MLTLISNIIVLCQYANSGQEGRHPCGVSRHSGRIEVFLEKLRLDAVAQGCHRHYVRLKPIIPEHGTAVSGKIRGKFFS